jgi:hypothetical protein
LHHKCVLAAASGPLAGRYGLYPPLFPYVAYGFPKTSRASAR